MIEETFNIRGMICSRCIKVLYNELSTAGAEVLDIALGSVRIRYDQGLFHRSALEKIITENDFDLIEDEDYILAERAKRWLIVYVWRGENTENASTFLATKLKTTYSSISKNFLKYQGKTVERYVVLLKMERAKELIEYDEMTFDEISFSLGYNNVSALARQFKKEAGMTMGEYKKNRSKARIPLDRI